MVIGITDTLKPNFVFYEQWVRNVVPDAKITRLSPLRRNGGELERCGGVVLSGGGDVHPRYYGREDAMNSVKGVNEERDGFEFGIVTQAMKAAMPVLAICRGMQLFNVAMGGSLIPDVERAGFRNHRKDEVDLDRLHEVHVATGTMLHSLVGVTRGNVNSAHHQSLDRLGGGLRVSAKSPDGVVEAAEWEEPGKHPFMLMVQWHPERMKDSENPFCRTILSRFVQEINRGGSVQDG